MSSFALRCLALICMLCDRVPPSLIYGFPALRAPGALAFPIGCFLLALGFRHTRSLKMYGRRLALCALASEVPYDLLLFGSPLCPAEQNPVFSLLLCLLMLWLDRRITRARPKGSAPLRLALLWACCLAAMALRLACGFLGPLLCFCFARADCGRGRSALACLLLTPLWTLFLFLSRVDSAYVLLSLAAPLSALPVLLYSGRPGPKSRRLSLLFYLAVPLHLLGCLFLRSLRLLPPWFLRF